jgi:glycosyltransferase involved in cell wall biosynthesis
MHILFVTLGFYPAQGWGGPVKVVHQNGRELVRRGHKVTVYCTNLLNKREKIQPGTFEREIDGMRIVYFDTWNLKWWPGTLGPIWLPELPAFLKREIHNFDVVHMNGYRSPINLPIVRAARLANLPVITQPHGSLPIIVNSQGLKRIYDLLLGHKELEGISALLALQESERQQALSHGIPESRIFIIPNGIDPVEKECLPEWGSIRNRFGLALDRPLILFLGRINKKKGTDLLVESFARMSDHSAQLVIAGPDDGQLNEVQKLIQIHGLGERVSLPGLLVGQDVLAAFQDADLFVLPCRADTFPVAIMESCMMNTPMVITDRCEIADLVQGRIGDVVPFDIQAFANGMDELLMNRTKYEKYKSNCSQAIADTFSIQAVVNQLEKIYRNTIDEKQNERVG